MGLLLFLYPFAEIYAWYKFIEIYSFGDAFLLALTGGILGLSIMMMQGRIALLEIQSSFAKGQVPASKALHRGLIMFGGFLIMIPGLLSKPVGTLLILPGFRHLLALYLKIVFAKKLANGAFKVFSMGGQNFGGFSAGFGMGGFQKPPSGFDINESPVERDVIEVVPKEISHKKIDN